MMDDESDSPVYVSAQLQAFFLFLKECNIHSGGKVMQTRSMPCRAVGSEQNFE